ncbi:MAG: BrnT family toxin [Methylorubrum rhodinum]|uniref:BrnT family toxin n=1 Tax=Methylorubrum rhodinum TaxID=29428 RepID=UPI003BB1C68A
MSKRRPNVTFDPAKSAWNVTQPGRADLPFEVAKDFDFETALVVEDTRSHPVTGEPYPERRYQGLGKIKARTVMMVYSPTADGYRVISLRSASKEERAAWQAKQTTS